jgi:tetratricopeptide (TPR) repeat protein
LRLDPVSLAITTDVGVIHYFAHEYDGAIGWYRKALELDSNFDRAHFWLAGAYEQKQMYDEAIAEYTVTIELSGGSLEARASLGHAYGRADRKDEAVRILDELDRESSSKYVSPYDLAVINLGLGENETALKWLVRACDEHAGWMIYLTVDPRLDPVRSDARFEELLRRVGFDT